MARVSPEALRVVIGRDAVINGQAACGVRQNHQSRHGSSEVLFSVGFPPVNWIDLTLLIVMILFGLRGYFRGLFREVFSLAGLVVGFVVAARYAEPLAGFAAMSWNIAPIVLKGVAFLICFFVIYLLFNAAGWLLHRAAKMMFLQTLNRLGGVVLGIGKGAALSALLVFTLTSTALVPRAAREKLDDAYLVVPLSRLADTLIHFGKTKIIQASGGAWATAGSLFARL